MADVGLSLDDIIKKSRGPTMRGRGGIRKGVARGARANGVTRGRGSQVIADARFKIIQKNREKLTDARDKLAEIAKQTDARLKLDKLRAMQLKKIDNSMSMISRKTGRNGRLTLTTNKLSPAVSRPMPTGYMPTSTRVVGYRSNMVEPHFMSNINMDFADDYMMEAQALRRTINNEYAPTPPPPPPVFNIPKLASPYTWIKPSSMDVSRGSSPRKLESERPRDFKVISRSSMGKPEPRSYREDWTFGTKSRTIITDSPPDAKYFESRTRREPGVKSRLDAVSTKSRTISGSLARSKSNSSSTSQSTGYRIVVSNLQANVTQEDIKELFEDVGELLVSRLVRPGTAEVIYKTLNDATKAVETYHNRQLDGHPMKCLLVNSRPKSNPTGPAVRSMTESRRSTSSSYVQPSLGAVHRALFDDL